jgi:hypothetical protein
MKIQSISVSMGLCLLPSLAGAAEAMGGRAIPGEPPVGTAAALPAGPVPAPEPAPTAPPADTGRRWERTRVGASDHMLNLNLEAASAYVWRGINKFGEDQNTQTFAMFPSITATLGGFSLGYWGAFQLSGDNKSVLVDSGVGAENDFILKYSAWLQRNLALSGSLTYFTHPFADADAAGTDDPMFLEPGIGISYLTGADLGLYVGYYRGLQSVTEPASFVYISPSIGKTFHVNEDLGLAVGVSAGYKAFTNDPPNEDRAFDLALTLSAAIPFSDMYITPQLHAAYVTRDDAVVPDAGFSDSFVAWAGLHVGYDVGM